MLPSSPDSTSTGVVIFGPETFQTRTDFSSPFFLYVDSKHKRETRGNTATAKSSFSFRDNKLFHYIIEITSHCDVTLAF